jgi:hypothetical protein
MGLRLIVEASARMRIEGDNIWQARSLAHGHGGT